MPHVGVSEPAILQGFEVGDAVDELTIDNEGDDANVCDDVDTNSGSADNKTEGCVIADFGRWMCHFLAACASISSTINRILEQQ